jgi:hypothetical protein
MTQVARSRVGGLGGSATDAADLRRAVVAPVPSSTAAVNLKLSSCALTEWKAPFQGGADPRSGAGVDAGPAGPGPGLRL